ncbi:hypothetical protein [Archaeoglobus sp.]
MDIEIASNDGFCEIRILDYSVGISDEIKDKNFRRRFQVWRLCKHRTWPMYCEKIVEYYGGKIWVEDNKSKGSIFVIRLKRFKR